MLTIVHSPMYDRLVILSKFFAVNFFVDDAAQVWLNGKPVINTANGGNVKAEALKLHQGWNHFLIKVVQGGGGWNFSGRLTCNQPDFLADLESALEKP